MTKVEGKKASGESGAQKTAATKRTIFSGTVCPAVVHLLQEEHLRVTRAERAAEM